MTYFFTFIFLFAAELLYFKIADKYNIIDKPNERSSHAKITLRGGGIIFYLGMVIYFIYSGFQFPYFFVGLTLISLISFVDDIKPLSSKIRLIIHFIAMLLMFYQWNFYLMPWYFWVIALIFCTGIINAYNFMDGINGITGGYSLVLAVALLYINSEIITFIDSKIIVILILSLLVFNFFNFRKKAKCFAGDVGAVSIAFILLFLIGKLVITSGDFTYVTLLAVYGVDVVLTIIHRILRKESLAEAHRKHMYQIMANELRISHLVVSSIYMLIQTIIITIFILSKNHIFTLIGSALILIALYVIFMKKYFYLHIQKK